MNEPETYHRIILQRDHMVIFVRQGKVSWIFIIYPFKDGPMNLFITPRITVWSHKERNNYLFTNIYQYTYMLVISIVLNA